jgi:hypothetical protein
MPQIVKPDPPYGGRGDQLVEQPAQVPGLKQRPNR